MRLRGFTLLQLLSRSTAFLPTVTASSTRRMRGGSRAAVSALTPQELLGPKRLDGAIGFEDLATIPRPGAQGLGQLSFSPDARFITYLGGSPTSLTRELYAYDTETGQARPVLTPPEGVGEEETMSKEEQLRCTPGLTSMGPEPSGWFGTAHKLPLPARAESAQWATFFHCRRERARIMSTGVTSYAWAAKASRPRPASAPVLRSTPAD